MDTKNPDLSEAVNKNLLKKIGEMAKDTKAQIVHEIKDSTGKSKSIILTKLPKS